MTVRLIQVGMLQTNCALLIDEQTKTCAVIDPGANSEKIMAACEEEGVKITHIFLTHGHFDHIMAAPEIQKLTGAKLYIHKADEHMLSPTFAGHRGYIKEEYVAPQIDGYLEDGGKIEVGSLQVEVMHTPGHTMGSCILLCQNVMLAGDTLFAGSCGRTDLEGGDPSLMAQSLRNIAKLEQNYQIAPGHMGTTNLDAEKATNPYLTR